MNTFENNISESEKSKKKISKFIENLDKLYLEKYNDIDTTQYFKIIKDKNNKTTYGYVLRLFHNYEMTGLISTYFSLKYSNPMYDIICFINETNIYESNYLNDLYLKYEKISDENISILKKLFDVVVSTSIIKIKSEKLHHSLNYEHNTLLGFILYSKILFIEFGSLINKNIDFIFDKYEKSTYSMTETHKSYSGGLFPSLILIIPSKYYIKKFEYLTENYNIIFNNLKFLIPAPSNILYFSIYPHWNNERFDDKLINYNFLRVPNIDIKYIGRDEYYIEYYYLNPSYSFMRDKTRFKLSLNNYIKWDKTVKRILDENPEYIKFFEYIKTYRNTLF